MEQGRRIIRHGFAIMTFGFVLGGVAGAVADRDHARLWLSSHVTALLVGLFMIAVGVVWPRLALGDRAAKALYASTVYGNWIGALILGLFVPAVGFASRFTTPELPPAPAWANAIVGLGLVVTTITTFAICVLILYGLRPAPAAQKEASAKSARVAEAQ